MTSGGTPGSQLAAELAAMGNNVYGFMHNASDPESFARAFARLGWQARRSAEGEYEVESSWCQLSLFDSGGMPKFAAWWSRPASTSWRTPSAHSTLTMRLSCMTSKGSLFERFCLEYGNRFAADQRTLIGRLRR
ncbi:hypothetical protein EDD30_5758 [Couchioplanes caeruleus]|uniref:Uncharacterized protein n=1 Tax=Couchioplanes caeruleus TaxID=56438 RepID=A0A3N1GRE4_9ACTN|nr:hypothetical protein EDD30_5758 [Couchioplanes caeruleus]